MAQNSNVEIHRTPVHIETVRNYDHCWTPVVNGKVVENPGDPNGLCGSIRTARKVAAAALGVAPDDLDPRIVK